MVSCASREGRVAPRAARRVARASTVAILRAPEAAVTRAMPRRIVAHLRNGAFPGTEHPDAIVHAPPGFDPSRNTVYAFLPTTHRALIYADRG